MKHKKTIIFLLIIYLILLSLSAAGYFISNSSKYIFSHSIERTSKNLLPNIKKSINLFSPINKEYKNNWHLNLNLVSENNTSNNKTNINGDVYYKENKYYISANAKNNIDNLNFQIFSNEDRIYFTVKDVLNSFYYIPSEKQDNKLLEKDINKIINYLEGSINEEITIKDFDKSKETIKLNNTQYKTTKVTLNLTDTLLNNITKTFINKLKNDTELSYSISKMVNMTEDEFKEYLDSLIKENKDIKNKKIFSYSIYVYNNQTLRHEIINDNIKYILEDYFDNNRHMNFIISEDNEKVLEIFTEKNNNDIKINGTMNDKIKFDGKLNRKKDEVKGNVNIKELDKETEAKTIKYKNNYMNDESKINLEITDNNLSKTTINATITDEVMPEVNTTNALNYETISEEDLTTIYTKIFSFILY